MCECIPRSLLLPCHGQPTQAACPTRAYKNVPLLFDVIIFAAGQKKFLILLGFLKGEYKELTHRVTIPWVKLCEKLADRISLFTALLPFLPFLAQ